MQELTGAKNNIWLSDEAKHDNFHFVFFFQGCQNCNQLFQKWQFCDASSRTVKSAFWQVPVHKNTSHCTPLIFDCFEKTAVKRGCFS